jgi:hypothetical protein
MKICKDHWQVMREAVESRDMFGLVAKSGEAAMADQLRQLEEAQVTGSVSDQTTKETFDPLMSMNWHWMNEALRCGGLYLMGENADAADKEYCPVCEFVKHQKGFVAKEAIETVADSMRKYCIEQKLITGVQ